MKIQVTCEKPKYTAYIFLDENERCIKQSSKIPVDFVGKNLSWIKSYARGRKLGLRKMG